MHVLDVRHLLLVVAVAEEGNLTRAGESLNLTQSALSHRLVDIEKQLGTRLFHRTHRRLVLTEPGRRLLASARRVLDDLARTEEDLRLFGSDRRGLIRVTMARSTAYHWPPEVMKRFSEQYPEVEIRIDVAATAQPFEALQAGAIDLAIVINEPTDRSIALRPLFDTEFLVATAPGHPFAQRPFVTAAELAGETLLTFSPLTQSFVYTDLLEPAGLEPKRHMQVPLTEAAIDMVRAGLGVTIMPDLILQPYIDSGHVAGVRLTRPGITLQWKAAWVAARRPPKFFFAFIQTMVDYVPVANRPREPFVVVRG